MPDVDIKTGDILKWADKMEKRGADFAAGVVKKTKKWVENKQTKKLRMIKLARVRRRKSDNQRFAIQKDANRAAELLNRSNTASFTDIFKD